MDQTTLNVQMDEDVKRAFEAFCADMGIDASTAINMFAKTVIREQRFPFETASHDLDPFYSQSNQERLLEAKGRMESTGGSIHDLIEVEDD